MDFLNTSVYQTAYSSISAEHSTLYLWSLNLVYVSKETRVKLRFPYHKWAELGIYCFLQQLMWYPVVLCFSYSSVAKTELSSLAKLLIILDYFRLGLKFFWDHWCSWCQEMRCVESRHYFKRLLCFLCRCCK